MEIDFKWLEDKIFSRNLSEQERDALQHMIAIEHFAKGDVIMMQQEAGGRLYLLRSGSVDVIVGFNGESLKLADLGEGVRLGDMSFIDDAEASATIIAREDCVAYRVTRDALSRLFASQHCMARDLMFSIIKKHG